ncbi:MAG TPA: YsnF/AvaK domain-containing protein [Symbiobacteriaceae bacterium]|nr:YsnF/AvaK domain-containing protein [Symbiobacteriaceae bacterium]
MSWFGIFAGVLLLLVAIYFLVARPAGSADADERDDATVVLREEQLSLGKTREQLADVTTHTEVRREMKTVTVPVTREELVVEKNGVEAVRIPICEERIDVSTRSVPLHEVSVHRRKWEENKEISAVLKKEIARVETSGAAKYSEETSIGDREV